MTCAQSDCKLHNALAGGIKSATRRIHEQPLMALDRFAQAVGLGSITTMIQ